MILTAFCLAASTAFAQSGDDCPPSTNISVSASCPSITDYGAIDTTSFCVNQGSDPAMPQLTNHPAASSGSLTTTTTTTASDCSTTTTTATIPVTYSFSGLQYKPAAPTKSSPPKTYQSDCYVTVTSSDTNDCNPDSPIIDYGTITWNVINTNVTTLVIKPADTLKAITQAISLIQSASKAAGCSGTNMTFQGEIDCSWQQVCCDSTTGPYKKSSVTGSIQVGLPSVTCPIPGASVPIPPPVNQFVQLGLTFTMNGSGNASATLGVAQPCQQQSICVNAGATISGALALSAKVSAPYGWATCSASAGGSASCTVQTSGPDSQGSCLIAANLGKCDLNWSVTLSSVGVCKTWSDSKNLWTGYAITNSTDCMSF